MALPAPCVSCSAQSAVKCAVVRGERLSETHDSCCTPISERETKWLLSEPEGEPKIVTANWKLRLRLNGKILFHASGLYHFNLDIMSVSVGTVLLSNICIYDDISTEIWVNLYKPIKNGNENMWRQFCCLFCFLFFHGMFHGMLY